MSGRVEVERRRGWGVEPRFDAARGPGQMPPRLYIMGSRGGWGRKLNGVYLRFAPCPGVLRLYGPARRQDAAPNHKQRIESHSMTDPNYVLVMQNL